MNPEIDEMKQRMQQHNLQPVLALHQRKQGSSLRQLSLQIGRKNHSLDFKRGVKNTL